MSFSIFEVHNKDNDVLPQSIPWYHLVPYPCKNIYSAPSVHFTVHMSDIASCPLGGKTCPIENLFFSIFFKTEENGPGC